MIAQSRVWFKYKTEKTNIQEIRLTGNIEALGNWNPWEGIRITQFWSPFWLSHCICLPASVSIEYKYFFVTVSGEGEWESLPYNRKLRLRNETTTIEDENNNFTSKIYVSRPEQPQELHPSPPRKNPISPRPIKRIILASQNLPFKFHKESFSLRRSKGIWINLLYRAMKNSQLEFVWIGWPSQFVPVEDQPRVTALYLSKKCVPVYIPEDLMHKHSAFVNNVLRKIMHNIMPLQNIKLDDLWKAYREVNILFTEAIIKHHTNHSIWIHDYHLFLVPQFLTAKTKEALNIGIFIHTPFPTSEVFRSFPYNEGLLYGLCCCDVIGFHSFDYARHFIGACKRVIDIELELIRGGYISLSFSGRNVLLRICHIGIEAQYIEDRLQHVKFTESISQYVTISKRKKMFLGVDSLDQLSGIQLKLRAFQQTMRGLPHRQESTLLLQVITSSKGQEPELLDELVALKDEINGEFGRTMVKFIIKDITLEERIALMWLSSGLINTSLRDGMCLLPFEYLVVNKYKEPVIIASEFAGVSRALSSPLKINPFSIAEMEQNFSKLLNRTYRPISESSLQCDLEYIRAHSTQKWAFHFLEDLSSAYKKCEYYQYVELGIGDKLKIIALPKPFDHLDKQALLEAYISTSHRALFFDNEGTLCNFGKHLEIEHSVPPEPEILQDLDGLCRDNCNTVFIITGREIPVLEAWYRSVQFLGMAAEYGAFLKWNAREDWIRKCKSSNAWKDTVIEIISGYAQRTEGSKMIVKEESVVFFYRDTEAEFAERQARDLKYQLETCLEPFLEDCEISTGHKYVEVKPRLMNKGTAIYNILQSVCTKNGPIDFILAIGDDIADEQMFRMIDYLEQSKSPLFADHIKIFTITVGIKASSARYFVNHNDEINQFLSLIKNWSVYVKNRKIADNTSRVGLVVNTQRDREAVAEDLVSPQNFYSSTKKTKIE